MWCVIPAAGRGSRFGAEVPKQYLAVLGKPVIEWTLRRLASHPQIDGLMVALAADDRYWPGWSSLEGKPVRTCIGGAQRADSVLAGLEALAGVVTPSDWVLGHDAARPCVSHADLERLIHAGRGDAVGAILAARARDTLKRADAKGRIAATLPRENVWRALTPQMLRIGELTAALRENESEASAFTDDANALEARGQFPLLVEGSEDNLKLTLPEDVALLEAILRRQIAAGS
jgi:2-C-methyl-D-erythritol 4-phosphate cytidylyltransferase